MEKPNINRMIWIWAPEWNSDHKELISNLNKDWTDLEKSNFEGISLDEISKLLTKHDLKSFESDFILICSIFSRRIKFSKEVEEFSKDLKIKQLELLTALKVLSNSFDESKITIKGPHTKDSVKIENAELKMVIFTALSDYYTDDLFDISTGEYFKDGDKSLIDQVDLEISKLKPRGRKKGSFSLKKASFILWQYLQRFTNLKADPDKNYSQCQVEFIYELLRICDLIDQKDRGGDNIAYYIKKFGNTKISDLPNLNQ
jgi:hypothetical protein